MNENKDPDAKSASLPPELRLIFSHYQGLLKPFVSTSVDDDFIRYNSSDFGRFFNLKRLAAHYVLLPPQSRTSHPHAESSEEEFFYVLSGKPELWLNGKIIHLSPGHSVGFAAGTGIGHSVLNNSNENVELLVLGEKTKTNNLCSFPINPEVAARSGINWLKAPKQALGQHLGIPGNPTAGDVAPAKQEFICFCPELGKAGGFHYPGDNETFGAGHRLTNLLGLKALGIWYEILPPGCRSSWPHFHTHEEEFGFVISGAPTLYLNGHGMQIDAGTAFGFLPMTGIDHCLINETPFPVTYIGMGETQEFPGEKIFYPEHSLRNRECQRKRTLWEDHPKQTRGTYRPQLIFPSDHLRFELCTELDFHEVLDIFEKQPEYFRKVEGCLPNLNFVKESITGKPKNLTANYFKEFLIIRQNERSVGVVDLHCHHPENGITYIGLLLLKESETKNGLGSKTFKLIEDYIRRSYQCDSIRIGISDHNSVDGFWLKMGFQKSDRTYEWQGQERKSLVSEYSKKIKD